MHDPQTLNFSPKDIAVETIEQFYFTVDPQRKFDLLVRLLVREEPQQAIIFCRTKRGTEKIYQRLSKKFEDVACMHGDMNQSRATASWPASATARCVSWSPPTSSAAAST